jgi:glycosyltransferase involved in cell wall biosynthesis
MAAVLPFVSVLTPTYNRRRFIPFLIECFNRQDYPNDRIEWIILDDGDGVGDLFSASGVNNIRYYHERVKLNIGAKRNKLNRLANGDIIVCMDDDDFYPPDRISHAVNSLVTNPKFNICGSSELYIFYSDDKTVYKAGPYSVNHATNGTIAYRKSYLDNHKYDMAMTKAEEASFLNNFTEPMLQLDPLKTQLLMCHSTNTVDKKTMRNQIGPVFKITQFTLRDFIKDARLYEFYNSI